MKKSPDKELSQPEAWMPGFLGAYELSMLRQIYQQWWAIRAKRANKARPLSERLSGKNKIMAEDKMLDEAYADKAVIESGGLPDTLQNQRMGRETLKLAGIDLPRIFSTPEELKDALDRS